jgi:hypothetical protein
MPEGQNGIPTKPSVSPQIMLCNVIDTQQAILQASIISRPRGIGYKSSLDVEKVACFMQ